MEMVKKTLLAAVLVMLCSALLFAAGSQEADSSGANSGARITSYNVCYTKLLRGFQ